ncbi:MAG: BamA/TamA family outer membrane protein [Ectothiorhodospiraceae bacterium]|nr:BamA/TamA family outer membrane protein [Ectothiorhodospiraceae bacterium]
MATHRFRAILALGLWLVLPGLFQPVLAQTPPPPGSFTDPGARQQEERRQLEREQERREAERPETEVLIDGLRREDDFRLPDEGPSFHLQGVRFSRTELLEEQDLREVTSRYVGREVDFGELNALVDEINVLYDTKGAVTARALIPPQEIQAGVVHILLVEGRLGELIIGELRYTRPEFILDRVTLPEPGEIMDLLALQETLSRFNTIYELDLVAGLEPGEEFGHSNILLLPQERPRWQVTGFADNAGTETTGRARAGLTGTYRGLLGRDARLFAYAAGARSSLSGFTSYSVPVNRQGGRIEASLSANDIEVTRGPFRDLDIEGRSYTGELSYRHPLLRRDRWMIDGTTRGSYTESRTDYLGGLALSRYALSKGGVGARVTHPGRLHPASLGQNVTSVDAEERRSDVRDRYVLWTGSATWVQYYPIPIYTVLSGNWQITSERELPSADLYQAGGLYSVRGYEQNVITGARGYSTSLELHWPVHHRLAPYLFVDHGAIQAISPRNEEITGAGVGVNWRLNRYLSGQLDYARGLTRIEPDQDRMQLHFRVTLAFDGG